jgi:hypothetical protein
MKMRVSGIQGLRFTEKESSKNELGVRGEIHQERWYALKKGAFALSSLRQSLKSKT